MPPQITLAFIAVDFVILLAVLYMLAIKPNVRRPQTRRFMRGIYAHRGLHNAERPENSMAAFRAAVEAGYDIELDVQLSRDGVPMVFHDATLNRVCGIDARLSDYTAEELQKMPLCGLASHTIPTLADVLAMVDGRVMLMVEIKAEKNAAPVCEGAAALLDAYSGPFCVESFSPYAVRWCRDNRPNWVRGQLSSRFLRDPRHRNVSGAIMQFLLTNFLTKPDFISFDRRYNRFLPFVLVRKFYHAYTAGWTVKSRAQQIVSRDSFDCIIFEGYLPEKRGKK